MLNRINIDCYWILWLLVFLVFNVWVLLLCERLLILILVVVLIEICSDLLLLLLFVILFLDIFKNGIGLEFFLRVLFFVFF